MWQIILQNLGSANAEGLSPTISFLTAMITPALLISASGTLVLSTSTRLGRVVDRVRQLSTELEELIMVENKDDIALYHEKLEVHFRLLDKVTSRSRILQGAMTAFYRGLGCFVLTSLTIGVVGIVGNYLWTPIPVGMIGIVFVAYGSFLMIRETRLATEGINIEMNFTWGLAQQLAPEDLAKHLSIKGWRDSEKKRHEIENFRTKIQNALAKRRTAKKG